MTIQTMYSPQKDSPSTVLQGDILASDTIFLVLNASILPQSTPFPLTLGFDTTSTETVMVTAINTSTNQLTVVRTDGRIWPAGTKLARVFNADDLQTVQNNVLDLQSQLNTLPLSDNIFMNGGFNVWKNINDTAVTTTRRFSAVRWAVSTGAGTLSVVYRSDNVRQGSFSKYSLGLSGAAGVTVVGISQRIESVLASLYKRQITFSAYIYNNSGASFTPKLYVSTPTAENNWSGITVCNGSGLGDDLQSCPNNQWSKVFWTADISEYVNINNGVEFKLLIPSGVLLAGKSINLSEMNLTSGNVAKPFIQRHLEIEEVLCRRFLIKSQFSQIIRSYITSGFAYDFITIPEMRATPTVLLSSMSYSNGNSGGAANITSTGFEVYFNCTAAGAYMFYQYIAESEL